MHVRCGMDKKANRALNLQPGLDKLSKLRFMLAVQICSNNIKRVRN